jgi:hypothetical protein
MKLDASLSFDPQIWELVGAILAHVMAELRAPMKADDFVVGGGGDMEVPYTTLYTIVHTMVYDLRESRATGRRRSFQTSG